MPGLGGGVVVEGKAAFETTADVRVGVAPGAPFAEGKESGQVVTEGDFLEQEVGEGSGGFADDEARMTTAFDEDDGPAQPPCDGGEEGSGESTAHNAEIEVSGHGVKVYRCVGWVPRVEVIGRKRGEGLRWILQSKMGELQGGNGPPEGKSKPGIGTKENWSSGGCDGRMQLVSEPSGLVLGHPASVEAGLDGGRGESSRPGFWESCQCRMCQMPVI